MGFRVVPGIQNEWFSRAFVGWMCRRDQQKPDSVGQENDHIQIQIMFFGATFFDFKKSRKIDLYKKNRQKI